MPWKNIIDIVSKKQVNTECLYDQCSYYSHYNIEVSLNLLIISSVQMTPSFIYSLKLVKKVALINWNRSCWKGNSIGLLNMCFINLQKRLFIWRVMMLRIGILNLLILHLIIVGNSKLSISMKLYGFNHNFLIIIKWLCLKISVY